MHKHQDIADKYAGEQCQVYTLDGIKTAVIQGRLNDFAVIRSYEGHVWHFNWPLVERKMQSDKLFYVC
jgi:hypothetical protein